MRSLKAVVWSHCMVSCLSDTTIVIHIIPLHKYCTDMRHPQISVEDIDSDVQDSDCRICWRFRWGYGRMWLALYTGSASHVQIHQGGTEQKVTPQGERGEITWTWIISVSTCSPSLDHTTHRQTSRLTEKEGKAQLGYGSSRLEDIKYAESSGEIKIYKYKYNVTVISHAESSEQTYQAFVNNRLNSLILCTRKIYWYIKLFIKLYYHYQCM